MTTVVISGTSAVGGAMPLAPRRKFTRSLQCMRIDKVVGSGTFGVVYRAVDKSAAAIVALKKIKMEREVQGFPVTALREIKILSMMKHPNVVQLREIVTFNERDEEEEPSLKGHGLCIGDVFMVFEFVDYDLAGLLKSRHFEFSPTLIKCFTRQLLEGVGYLHNNKILHRDIKSANLLITRGNVLKIADWGLARSLPPSNVAPKMTVPVVTLWYRSPELILGSKQYGPEVDIWSVGCILGEMWTRVALFRGDREMVQLEHIFALLGSPTGSLLSYYQSLPDWSKFSQRLFSPRLHTKMGSLVASSALALMERLLDLNPASRISAFDALQHSYVTADPVVSPEDLPPIAIAPVTEYFEQERTRRERSAPAPADTAVERTQVDGHPPRPPREHSDERHKSFLENRAKRRLEDMEKNPRLKMNVKTRKEMESSTTAIATINVQGEHPSSTSGAAPPDNMRNRGDPPRGPPYYKK